ncbi:MAG: hypothetical protein KME26_05440 [Oscillatoria princeps RMCB-10]|nr:hypothetical protein [Oscillatoria princeps RMCB-10]
MAVASPKRRTGVFSDPKPDVGQASCLSSHASRQSSPQVRCAGLSYALGLLIPGKRNAPYLLSRTGVSPVGSR